MEETKQLNGVLTPILPGFCSLEIVTEAPEVKSSKLHVYFAIDKSGSMSGPRIQTAKEAVKTLIETLKQENISMSIIAFESSATIVDSRDFGTEGYSKLLSFCKDIQATGGTEFVRVFECLQKQMRKFQDLNNVIVFVTDGQDGSGRERLTGAMEEFKSFIGSQGYRCAIHAVGVGEGHDANLLTTILKYGSNPGTFQYVQDSTAIAKAVENLQGVMEVNVVSGTLKLPGGGEHRINMEQVSSEESTAKNLVRGVAFLKEAEVSEDLAFELHAGKETQKFKVKTVKADKPVAPSQFADFVRDRVVGMIEVLRKGAVPEEQRSTFITLIKAVDAKVDEMMEAVRKLSTPERKHLMPVCLDLKDLTGEFYVVLQKDLSARGLENVALAKLNDVVYRGVLKKGLAKKLNKRFEQNVGLIESIDQAVEKVVKTFNREELAKKYAPEKGKRLEDDGYCLISCKNWLEALMDYDCVCVTFNAERSQAAIADPNQVCIRAVNTTQLTCESFMDSAIFHNSHPEEEEEKSKPSFTKGTLASSLVKGLPDETITGIMPLYINEDHWKVARLKMKPLMGWTATLDVMGYAPAQMITIPFLLFSKAAEDLSGDFQKKVFQQIKDTCLAIYREHKKSILPTLLPTLSKYVEDPLVRTVDSVPHNQVFLAHLYFAMLEKDLDIDITASLRTALPHIMEEEIRRRLFWNVPQDPNPLILEVIGISSAEYIEAYASSILSKIADIATLKFDTTAGLEKLDGSILALSKEVQVKKERFEKLFEKATPLYTLSRMFGLFSLSVCCSLADIGIDTNEKFAVLCIESILQHRNADRRDAVTQGRYVSPFSQETVKAFLKKLSVDTVVSERKKREAAAISDKVAMIGKAKGERFAKTEDMKVAVETVGSVMVNSAEYGEIVRYVQTHPMARALEKAQLLVSRKFEGKRVIQGDGDKEWEYGKASTYRLWRQNREKVPDVAAWQKIFSKYAERIQLYEDMWNHGTIFKFSMKTYK